MSTPAMATMNRAALAGATFVTLLVGCTSSSSSGRVAPLEGVGFASFAAAPTDVRDGKPETGIISLLVTNDRDSALRITRVEPKTLKAVGEGVATLRQRCLYLKGAVATLSGGRRVWLTFDDGAAIGAVKLPHGRDCDSNAVVTPRPPVT